MTVLDMAAGIQTLANEGVHKQPYYVEFIDDAEGNRVHTHFDQGENVLDRDVALETVDIMKGTISYGTGRQRAPLADGRPAFGKTGTQENNTNAWFAQIWKSYMDGAHFGLPAEDWDAPAPPKRANARLVLPGNECEITILVSSGGEPIEPVEPEAPPVAVEQFQTEPTPPEEPALSVPVETIPVVVITAKSQLGTTIAPDNLDPNYPLPSVAIGRNIAPC